MTIPPIDRRLDARAMRCPLPVLKARRLMSEMKIGEVIEIIATDPGAPQDFASFAEINHYDLLANEECDGVFRIIIAKT